jgi:hypothetical protein
MVPFFKLALQQIKHEKGGVWYVTEIAWCETEYKRHSKQQLKLQTTRSDNTVSKLATVCLPWQQWIENLVWFDDVDILAFHSCVVVVDLWLSLSEWRLLLSECVFVCRHKNVGA